MTPPDLPLEELNWPPEIERRARQTFTSHGLWLVFKTGLNWVIENDRDAGNRVDEQFWKAVVETAKRYPDYAFVSGQPDYRDLYWLGHRDENSERSWKVFYDGSDERISYANVVAFLVTPLPPR